MAERFRPPAARNNAVSTACRRPSDFLFAWPKRKSPKRKATPGQRSPGILPCECVRRCRAFRAGSCPREKASPSVGSPAARPDRPRLTAAQGPLEKQRAPGAQKQPQNQSEAKARSEQSQSGAPRREALPPQFPDTSRRGRTVYRIGGSGSKALGASGLYSRRIEPGHFSWFLLLTPGIVPCALRASFAVRRSSCGSVGQQREVTRAPAGARNRFVPNGRRPKPLGPERQAPKTPTAGEPDREARKTPPEA
jgi:hypothetical protein